MYNKIARFLLDMDAEEWKMNGTEKKRGKGVPLQTVIIVMLVISAAISCVLLYFMYRTSESYDRMRIATQHYMDCQAAASSLREGSDYLTNQVRSFVITGDMEHVALYYNEVQTTRSRDKAVEQVREYLVDDRALSQLDTALQISDRLMETEEYAMRLMVAGLADDIDRYPAPLRQIALTDADSLLPPQQQLEKARRMVFGDEYEAAKEEIISRINQGTDVLMTSMLGEQVTSSDRLLNVLHAQQILIGGLMLSLFLVAVVIFSLIINPLRRQISGISQDRLLSEEGTTELQYLARTYNEMYAQNQRAAEKLNYEATHDALTRLYNRAAYESMRQQAMRSQSKIALLLVDVDYFKSINDQYGHDMGDRVLRSVADILQGSFRGEDMVCRIGGDEFAVIMANVDSALTELVRGKMRRVADRLAHPAEDLPAVTLSVGVAFSDQQSEARDLFKCADLALYRVKEAGRNGCGFYDPSL